MTDALRRLARRLLKPLPFDQSNLPHWIRRLLGLD